MKRTPTSQRITLLVLALMLVLGLGSYGMVNAEETYEISVSNAVAEAGSTVTLDVAIAPGSGFSAAQLNFSFDPDKLTYVEPANENLAKGEDLLTFEEIEGDQFMVINANDAAIGKVSMAYINTAAFTAGGNIFKLTFKVKGDATGTIPVDVAVKELSKDNNGVALPILTTIHAGSVKVGSPLSLENFNPDKASAQVVNTGITLTALGSGGTKPYEYQFYYQLGTETVVFKDFSEINNGVFTPTATGTYMLFVDVKDADGNTVTGAIENYQISPKFYIKTFEANPASSQYINTPIKLSTEAMDGKTPYQYQYSYTLNGTTTIFRPYSNTATASFTPTKAGVYTLSVDVKDTNGNIGTRSIDTYTVVANPTVTSFTTDKPSGQGVNTSIQLTAAGSDGRTPYQYKFYYKSGSKITIIQNFSEANTTNFKPTTAGTYTLCVDLKDAAGKTSSKSIANYVVVKSLAVKSFTADKASGQGTGTGIKLTAAASDGKTPYQYKFYYQLGLDTVTIRDFAVGNSTTFTPVKVGTYTLYVDVKDGSGKTVTGTINNYSIVGTLTVTSFTADKPSGQGINTSIQLDAAGNDGKTPYQYKFYYKSGSKTTIIQNFSEANTTNFKPTTAGTYTLCVDLKDAAGKTSSKSIANYVVVKSLAVKSFTADKASGQGTGTGIKLTAAASDGKTPYQYKFYYQLGLDTVTIRDFAVGNSTTFTPTTVGTYTLYVDVKDGSGKTVTGTINNYSIVGTPTVTFTTDKPSGQGINTSIQLEAAGNDGKTPYQYKFYYKQGTKTTIIKNFSGSSTVTFKPAKAGVYTLGVEVKDGNGKIGTASIADYTIYGSPSVKSFTADKASGQYINTGINLTALGSDGKTPYEYRFYYKLGTAIATIQDYSVADTASFTPTAAGIYTLCVDVRDANGKTSTKSITKYSVIKLPGVKSFKTDKVSGQKIGTSIKLSAAGIDGKTPYQYKFSYTLGATTVTIKDYSAAATVNFKPTKAGTYTLTVEMKDAGGKTDTKTIETFEIK